MIIFVIISCKKRDELGLTNPTKRWVYFDSYRKYDKDSMSFLTYLKFYENGKCVNLFFDDSQYNDYMEWNFTKSDSILQISDKRLLVLKIYKDSIIVKDLKYKRKAVMLNWNILPKKNDTSN